jgi:uroporphyrinogen decarboxylase
MIEVNSLRLVQDTVAMRTTERVPVIPQIFGHAAVFSNVPLNSYLKDGRLLAECQIGTMESYGYDATFAVMDVNVEAEALGATMVYREKNYPYIRDPFLGPGKDVAGLELPDPQRDGRMPEVLEALKIMSRDLDGKTLVTSALLGPFTLACQLLGTERALYLLADDREKFMKHIQFCTELAISYGKAQARAGSQVPIIFDPAASPAVMPPSLFKEIEVPVLARVGKALLDAGAMGTWIHVAGPTAKILPLYREIGVGVANFDYQVSPEVACEALPGTCLDGNVRSISFCLSSPREIRAESEKLLAAFKQRGGFILSSGCEIPPEAKPDCVRALVDAALKR